MFKRLFTWRGRINRREFIITFILGILLIHVFPYIASCMFSQHYLYGNPRLNIVMSFSYAAAILGIIFGLLPLLIFNLYSMNEMVIRWNGVHGIDVIQEIQNCFIDFSKQVFEYNVTSTVAGLIPSWSLLSSHFFSTSTFIFSGV